jgi:hypothetical protein
MTDQGRPLARGPSAPAPAERNRTPEAARPLPDGIGDHGLHHDALRAGHDERTPA